MSNGRFCFFIFLKKTTEKSRSTTCWMNGSHPLLWPHYGRNGCEGLWIELHVTKVSEKGMFVVAFCLGQVPRERRGENKMLLLMGFLSCARPFPKGPILQMVLSKVKRKTRKINTLSNNKELTLFPLK